MTLPHDSSSHQVLGRRDSELPGHGCRLLGGLVPLDMRSVQGSPPPAPPLTIHRRFLGVSFARVKDDKRRRLGCLSATICTLRSQLPLSHFPPPRTFYAASNTVPDSAVCDVSAPTNLLPPAPRSPGPCSSRVARFHRSCRPLVNP